MKDQNLYRKKLLELGAGSGLISFWSARQGALVTATDISETAVKGLLENAARNLLSVTILQSDLFKSIPIKEFDFIVINPPYYPKDPRNEREQAFYCGKNFDYFKKLFQQIPPYLTERTACRMILSEDCDIPEIRRLALEAGLDFEEIHRTRVMWEWNMIYALRVYNEPDF